MPRTAKLTQVAPLIPTPGAWNVHTHRLSVLLGQGNSSFLLPGVIATTAVHSTPLLADVNGDGTPDSVVLDGSGFILLRPGIPGSHGQFGSPLIVNQLAPPSAA